jgi:hypothetical protein
MPGQIAMSDRERRWAVIALNGRHTWLGRHSDPSDAELADVTRALAAHGAVAWLAIVEGVYYSPGELSVMQVRPLNGTGSFEDAVSAFLATRTAKLADLA